MIPIDLAELQDAAIYYKLREEKEIKFPLRPSSAGYCGRKLAYSLAEYLDLAKYEKEIIEPETYRLLELGHHVEESVIKNFELIEEAKFKYKQQVVTLFQLEPIQGVSQPIVEGSIDVAMEIDGELYIIDVKSKGDRFSSMSASKWDEEIASYSSNPHMQELTPGKSWYVHELDKFLDTLGDSYFANNFYQLNAYCFSDFFVARGVKYGIIYRYNKNTSRHSIIHFRANEEVFKRVRDKFNKVNTLTKTDGPEAVPRDYALGSMACAFCDYKKECWDEDALKAYFKTFPKKRWPTKASELPKEVIQLMSEFEEADASTKKATQLQEKVAAELNNLGVTKFQLPNGNIYEIKYLKSPYERFVLRRGKL